MDKSHLSTCPVCGEYEKEVRSVTERLNEAQEVREKAKYAQQLLEAEKILSLCPMYVAGEEPEIQVHHKMVGLRRKSAEMILKVKPLGKAE